MCKTHQCKWCKCEEHEEYDFWYDIHCESTISINKFTGKMENVPCPLC